jgi:hypothetical protein
LTYTLLFGNNFVSDSPKSVNFCGRTLFLLNEDTTGPYLTARIFDATADNLIVKVQENVCTYCSQKLIMERNERNHILINNHEGENIIQSRILDKKTILISGVFSYKDFIVTVTQNYILLPNGKKVMYDRVSARSGSVRITYDEGIIPEEVANT